LESRCRQRIGSIRTPPARADEIAQRLFLGAADADRVQLASPQQPHQVLGVATVGLDPPARRARDLVSAATTTSMPRRMSSPERAAS